MISPAIVLLVSASIAFIIAYILWFIFSIFKKPGNSSDETDIKALGIVSKYTAYLFLCSFLWLLMPHYEASYVLVPLKTETFLAKTADGFLKYNGVTNPYTNEVINLNKAFNKTFDDGTIVYFRHHFSPKYFLDSTSFDRVILKEEREQVVGENEGEAFIKDLTK